MIDSKFIENYPLKYTTTYRIGGPARYFFVANGIKDLLEALEYSKHAGLPFFLLGGGSNVLISDKGFPGIVIKLGRDFNEIEIGEEEQIVVSGGAVKLPKLGMRLVTNGWGGFEFMCGIPGTVGGAVRINAGTKGGEIKDNFISAKVLNTDLQISLLDNDKMNFLYRNSSLMGNEGIVLEATFGLKHKRNVKELKRIVKEILLNRKLKQPKNHRNCGSVFKKPKKGKPAGWYIEEAGLKGMRIGNAQVALEHANWIVNLGDAKATDIKMLIQYIQEKVLSKFGVQLEREVLYIPEDLSEKGRK